MKTSALFFAAFGHHAAAAVLIPFTRQATRYPPMVSPAESAHDVAAAAIPWASDAATVPPPASKDDSLCLAAEPVGCYSKEETTPEGPWGGRLYSRDPDETPPLERESPRRPGVSGVGLLIAFIVGFLVVLALVMTVFWKCRQRRWRRLEQVENGKPSENPEAALMSSPLASSAAAAARSDDAPPTQKKPLPTTVASSSQILASSSSQPSAHEAR